MEPIPTQPTPHQTTLVKKLVLFLILIISFIAAFTGGYLLRELLSIESVPPRKAQVIPTPTKPAASIAPTEHKESDTTLFLPGKTYFEDTIIAVTKNEPHYSVVISARRSEQEKGFIQSTGFSFFDGKTWQRKQDTKETPSSQIMTNTLIKNWEVTIHPSRVLKEALSASMSMSGKAITVQSQDLTNEIGMRSLPGYTKFMSNASGIMQIDGTSYESYILYTRIYSLNAKDIQFYDQPLGVTTFWIAFWDMSGNFYHVDKSLVERPTDIYKTHEIVVYETPQKSIEKSFTVGINPDTNKPPKTLEITTNLVNNAILAIQRETLLNKAPDNSYTWTMSTVNGSIKTATGQTNGFGLMEYIND